MTRSKTHKRSRMKSFKIPTKAELVALYQAAVDKQLMHYAASLSFHSVLSLIPLLLISLGIFTKLPAFEHYFNKLKEFIFESLLPSNQEQIASYIETFLTNIGSLGIFGFLAVGFTSIMFFGDYIFVIKNLTNAAARGFWRTFSIYWTTMTLMPIALAFSFYLAATIQRTFDLQASGINLVAFLPNLIIWAIFCFTYSITINREMKLRNILLASFFSSFTWIISKWLFVQYTLYNKSYQSIYGSFSVLFFFLLWLYFSWVIFLYGVKVLVLLEDGKIKLWREKSKNDQPN